MIPGYTSALVRDITSIGSLFFYLCVMGFALVFRETRALYGLTLGLVFIVMVAALLRSLFFRERPKKRDYTTGLQKIDAASFPSVHAARAAYLGTFFIIHFGISLPGLLVIILSCAAVWSRYFLKEHHLTDVLVGAIIGSGIAFATFYTI